MMRWHESAYRWTIYVCDLDDGSGNADWTRSSLSATKLSGYLAVVVGLLVTLKELEASTAANVLVGMGISALFGRSMWKTWLGRNTFSTHAQTSESKTKVEIHETKEIRSRRADGGEFEPSP